MSDEQLSEIDLPKLKLSAYNELLEDLVKELQHVEQQWVNLTCALNLLTFDYPLVLPPVDLTMPPPLPPAKSVGRLLSSLFALSRPPQIDPQKSPEEWRADRLREHAKVDFEMKQLQITAEQLLQSIDLIDLLPFCYAEEKLVDRSGAISRFLFDSSASLPIRKRIGDELWAESMRQLDEEEKLDGNDSNDRKLDGNELRDIDKIRFLLLKLTFWSNNSNLEDQIFQNDRELSVEDVDLLGDELGVQIPDPDRLPFSLPIVNSIKEDKWPKMKRDNLGRRLNLLNLLESKDMKGVVSVSNLQMWVAKGSHLSYRTMRSVWKLRMKELAVNLLGQKYEYRQVHARATLRAEIRRRERAELIMQHSLQLLLSELFLPPTTPTTELTLFDESLEIHDENKEPSESVEEIEMRLETERLKNEILIRERVQSVLSSVHKAVNDFNRMRLRNMKFDFLLPLPRETMRGIFRKSNAKAKAINSNSKKMKSIVVSSSNRQKVIPKNELKETDDAMEKENLNEKLFISHWRRFAFLRAQKEDFEDSLLFEHLEGYSARKMLGQLLLAIFLPPFGRTIRRLQWNKEMMLAKEMRTLLHLTQLMMVTKQDEVNDSNGELVDEPLTSLEIWLRCLDVDCSGSFHGSRLPKLLQTIGYNISPENLLVYFPQLKKAGGRLSIREVVSFLQEKEMQEWEGRGDTARASRIKVASRFRVALVLLTSWSACETRRGWQKSLSLAIVHPGGHHILSDVHSFDETGAGNKSLLHSKPSHTPYVSNQMSRVIRAQLLSERQVNLFVRTTHGKICLAEMRARVFQAWLVDLAMFSTLPGQDRPAIDIVPYLMKYAHFLFCERGGMLVTELPYFLQFLQKRMKLTFKDDVFNVISAEMGKIRSGRIPSLTFRDIWRLLSNFLSLTSDDSSALRPRKSVSGDAMIALRSCARQQAVLIASNSLQEIEVPETNYRCAVLGLHSVLEKNRRDKRSKWTLDRRNKNRKVKVDMQNIPMESAALFLLSKGLKIADLLNESVARELGLGAFRGQLGSLRRDLVSTARLLEVFKAGNYEPNRSLFVRTLKACGKFVAGSQPPSLVYRYAYGVEFRRVTKALQLQGSEVDARGASYLAEIVTGISSSSSNLS